jgi:hypothetical protein
MREVTGLMLIRDPLQVLPAPACCSVSMWPEVHLSSSLSCNTPSPLLTLCTHAHMHTFDNETEGGEEGRGPQLG